MKHGSGMNEMKVNDSGMIGGLRRNGLSLFK